MERIAEEAKRAILTAHEVAFPVESPIRGVGNVYDPVTAEES